MLSVYTRHSADCKHYGDKLWRRCNCPKWIWGSLNGEFYRLSAKTRLLYEAEQYRHRLENPSVCSLPAGFADDTHARAPGCRFSRTSYFGSLRPNSNSTAAKAQNDHREGR